MKRDHLFGLLGFSLLFAVAGCSADTSNEEEVGTDSQAVIGGTVTREAPEVGMVSFSWGSYCTATLISPRVAITAAHCVRYNTADVTGSYGSFRIDKPTTGSTRYTVDRYRTFPRDGLGTNDVALIRLKDAVPSTVATPATVATSIPSNGTALTLYGYGCNDNWTDQTGGGTKRKFSYKSGETLRNRICPGDSGGPVRIASSGAVLFINSGWMSDWWNGRRDVFGEVPRHVDRIKSQQQSWNLSDPTTGVRAEYYDNDGLSGEPKVLRTDRTVDFDWGSAAPDAIIEGDTFSVRWESKLQPLATETYTLEVLSDDGVRLWVDNKLVIDDWVAHSPTTHTARVALTANGSHALRLEYFEKGGGAQAKLYWSSASQARQIIPNARLSRL